MKTTMCIWAISLRKAPFLRKKFWMSAARNVSRNTSSMKFRKCTASRGVEINDKHVEIIVRQMLRKVVITEPGNTEFLWGRPSGQDHVRPHQ